MRWILLTQIILCFFSPPVSFGIRKIFIADLWCWTWVSGIIIHEVYFRHKKNSLFSNFKEFKIFFWGVIFLLGVIFIHGMWRISAYEYMKSMDIRYSESDQFNFTKELVCYLRYASWIIGAKIVFEFYLSSQSTQKKLEDLSFLKSALALFCILIGSLMFLEQIIPVIKTSLANLYGFNPNYDHWLGRSYGVFSSPVEAGQTLSFAVILLLGRPIINTKLQYLGIGFAILGALLSKTASPLLALIFLGIIFLVDWKKLLTSKKFIVFFFITLFLFFGFLYFTESEFLYRKIGDFISRLTPWWIYVHLLTKRWDMLFLGYGFIPHHADNSYVYILARGGTILFCAVAYFMSLVVNKYWYGWSKIQKSMLGYLLIAGLMFDVIIIRYVVYLLITVVMIAMIPEKNLK